MVTIHGNGKTPKQSKEFTSWIRKKYLKNIALFIRSLQIIMILCYITFIWKWGIMSGFILTPADFARGAHATVSDARLPWSFARKGKHISYPFKSLLIISQNLLKIYSHIRQPLMVLKLKHNYSYYPSAEGARKFPKLNFYNMQVLYAQAKLLKKIVKKYK